ncbi:uncharacterized protein LOC116130344 isoform X2 [Pistacia vera]|uniref:uncharacterized protein LOC116130344 isoform X2 n=1 Tax=Pistacia vera TaxID=55513 RepID=UPI0012633439|nr:uncharacterized protein LOC116130344 isoform X2 [Pistacia vera]
MEKMGDLVGSRQSDLNKSFKLAIRSLLTTCSKQEFSKAFNNFTASEQDSLHRLFIQVITSLHENIEDEFQSLCLETQVGNTLDTVEQLVEEKSLDPLSSDKTNIMDVTCDLSTAKKNEIQYLMRMLERVEEQNHLTQARVEQLRKRTQDVSGMTDVEKFRGGMSNYGTCNGGLEDP